MQETDWNQLLDQLDESLAQAAGEVERHEQTLASPFMTGEPATERHIGWQQALERFGERLREYGERVQRAERVVADAEAALAEREQHIRQYQKRLDESRKQLAKVPAADVA